MVEEDKWIGLVTKDELCDLLKMEISVKELRKLLKINSTEFEKQLKELTNKIKQIEIIIENIKENQRCTTCGSFNTTKRGTRKTRNRGKIQKYTCKDCGARFSFYHPQQFRMRTNIKDVKKALKLRDEGLTLSQVAKEIGGKVSRQTVLRWEQKFKKEKWD